MPLLDDEDIPFDFGPDPGLPPDLTDDEIEAIRRAMAPKEREAAKERTSANLPNAKVSHLEPTGRSVDKIGSFAGVSLKVAIGGSLAGAATRGQGAAPTGETAAGGPR